MVPDFAMEVLVEVAAEVTAEIAGGLGYYL